MILHAHPDRGRFHSLRKNRKLAQIVRNRIKERINDKTRLMPPVDACEKNYHGHSLFLCLVNFCAHKFPAKSKTQQKKHTESGMYGILHR